MQNNLVVIIAITWAHWLCASCSYAQTVVTYVKEPSVIDQYWVDAITDLVFINFPSELGILSWRICFVNKQRKEQIAKIKSKEDLGKLRLYPNAVTPSPTNQQQLLRPNFYHHLATQTHRPPPILHVLKAIALEEQR